MLWSCKRHTIHQLVSFSVLIIMLLIIQLGTILYCIYTYPGEEMSGSRLKHDLLEVCAPFELTHVAWQQGDRAACTCIYTYIMKGLCTHT